jgi:superfamily II DNA/RNA helicase
VNPETPPVEPSRFDTLALDPKLLKAVAEMGYESMTPIQEQAIPVVLTGRT